MAVSSNILRHLMSSRFGCFYTTQVPAMRLLYCFRNISTSVTSTKRRSYPKTYPTLLVFPDGSTINIKYKDPRKIIKLPLDFSALSDAEKKKVIANRKPKQKLEVTEDFGEQIDISQYSKYFKQ